MPPPVDSPLGVVGEKPVGPLGVVVGPLGVMDGPLGVVDGVDGPLGVVEGPLGVVNGAAWGCEGCEDGRRAGWSGAARHQRALVGWVVWAACR